MFFDVKRVGAEPKIYRSVVLLLLLLKTLLSGLAYHTSQMTASIKHRLRRIQPELGVLHWSPVSCTRPRVEVEVHA